MTDRDLPFFPAFHLRLAAIGLLTTLALLAATAAGAAPMLGATDRPMHQHQPVGFSFGRGLVAAPSQSGATQPRREAVAADAAPAPADTRHVNPYRAACNFTTGCH